jgi:hypothetical protein
MNGRNWVQHLQVAVRVGGRDGLAQVCAAEQNTTSGVYARCWWLRTPLAAMTKMVCPWTAGSARVCSSGQGSAGLGVCVYYCSTYYKAFLEGGGGGEGNLIRDKTSRGRCELVCPCAVWLKITQTKKLP